MAATAALISVLIALFILSVPLISDAQNSGFTVDLIHRDSPKSPFYNPNETSSERTLNACQRSLTRVQLLDQNARLETPQSQIVASHGEYLMNVSLGTPPVNILAIADTGSELIWTQCKPCEHCYKQDAPLFDPEKSKTYKNVACGTRQCQTLKGAHCVDPNSCLYSISYADKSYTQGKLAVDTVMLRSTGGRSPVAFPKTVFGCGHNNNGTFNEKGSGVVGLNRRPLSLISQFKDSIDGKFSYCLVPFAYRGEKTSKLNFGRNAVVSGRGVVSTPLVKGAGEKLYVLKIKAISVNGNKINFSGSFFGSSGGKIFIDSGTTLTMLPSDVYSKLESAVANAVKGKRVVSRSKSVKLCYEASSGLKLPNITAHFDAADVALGNINTFIKVKNGVLCLAFAASNRSAVYGNVAQTNFLVGYDMAAGTVSFKPVDCTTV